MKDSLYDKNKIPILPGDTLKVFHYIAARRREKRYMYKFAQKVEPRSSSPPLLKIGHLDCTSGYYWQIMDGRVLPDYEIVQGYDGVESGYDYRDRKRKE